MDADVGTMVMIVAEVERCIKNSQNTEISIDFTIKQITVKHK